MLSVEEALSRVLKAARPTPSEQVPLREATGRVLAGDLTSLRSQPPCDVSAMDGYALRAGDVASVPVTLGVIGRAPAGGAYEGTLGEGEAVRIFTGGPVPQGADAIVLQEDCEADGDSVTVLEAATLNKHIRRAGIDFAEGDVLLHAGRILSAADIGLAASMNHAEVPLRARPKVAVLATGDELVLPGSEVGANQIVSSNSFALCALIEAHGGEALDLGIAVDDEDAIRTAAAKGRDADIFVTVGGASVGDHDLVQPALAKDGLTVDFWKIAMRPGKPLIFGAFKDAAMLGLPGNPVSAMVCATLFLLPLIRAMLGVEPPALPRSRARLGRALPANGKREDYMRAELARTNDGLVATPFDLQDSSVLSLFAHAGALVIRPPHAPAASIGDEVDVIVLR